MRKVRLDVGRRKALAIVDVLVGDLPYILFQSKSSKKNYVIVLFWDVDVKVCEISEQIQTTYVYPTTNFRGILRLKTLQNPNLKLPI